MMETLRSMLDRVVENIVFHLTTYVPPLIVAVLILGTFWLAALGFRWLITRAIKGGGIDRFLAESGLRSIIDHSEKLHGTPLLAGAVYWVILLSGFIFALNAFNTALTSRAVEAAAVLFPKAITAGILLLAGAWLAQLLGRAMLVWAANEELPFPRRIAALTRWITMFVAVVVASDVLDFAPRVFFAAFVILVGGIVLAGALAIGLGGRDAVRRHLEVQARKAEEGERTLWSHL